VNYLGQNQLDGTLNPNGKFGITGVGTPLNSDNVYNVDGLSIDLTGPTSGTLSIFANGGAFDATIFTSNVGPTGGTATFGGYLDSGAAAFFGVSPLTQLVGTLTIELSPALLPDGNGNDIANVQLNFTEGPFSVPEPSSLMMLALGLIGVGAWGYRLIRQNRQATGIGKSRHLVRLRGFDAPDRSDLVHF
jgi:hypothetical protein